MLATPSPHRPGEAASKWPSGIPGITPHPYEAPSKEITKQSEPSSPDSPQPSTSKDLGATPSIQQTRPSGKRTTLNCSWHEDGTSLSSLDLASRDLGLILSDEACHDLLTHSYITEYLPTTISILLLLLLKVFPFLPYILAKLYSAIVIAAAPFKALIAALKPFFIAPSILTLKKLSTAIV